jgi:hypothetical protein
VRTADTISLELHRKGAKVADLNSSTYGSFYASFAVQPLYVGFIIDWGLVFAAFGGGLYQVIAKKVILGVATTDSSRQFYLNTFDDQSANGTVKIEIKQDGNILSDVFDYTGLIAGGWPAYYRIPAWFGTKAPNLTTDTYESSDRTIRAVQPSVQYEYTMKTQILPSAIADAINSNVLLADAIFITSYALLAPRNYLRLPVSPISLTLSQEADRGEIYEAVFTDARNNTIRQY